MPRSKEEVTRRNKDLEEFFNRTYKDLLSDKYLTPTMRNYKAVKMTAEKFYLSVRRTQEIISSKSEPIIEAVSA